MNRIIFHIDCNNAFLSWSAIKLLEDGYKVDIRNIYAVIGGDEERRTGIVLAKSNLCKKLGIKTADTLYSARKKCKNLKVFPPNYKFYAKKSNELFNLLNNYSPDIEVASIDECYLDYTKVKNLYGDEVKFAYKLKNEIKEKLGFTVNIGIANNKLCAKMASDFRKPDKVHTLYESEIESKMYPLPISDLFGIGRNTVPKLNNLGIKTIGDLANFDINILKKYFKNQASTMIDSAKGINYDEVVSDRWIPKGIGNEVTLLYNTNNFEYIENNLLMIAENIGSRLRKEKKYAYVICVTVKDMNFVRKSHQKKIKVPTDSNEKIFNVAKEIYLRYFKEEKIRLIGIRLDDLVTEKYDQLSLFESKVDDVSSSKLDYVLDDLRKKYGKNIINKASIINTNKEFHK